MKLIAYIQVPEEMLDSQDLRQASGNDSVEQEEGTDRTLNVQDTECAFRSSYRVAVKKNEVI